LSGHCASSPKGNISIPDAALLDFDLTLFSRFKVCNSSSDSLVPGIGALAVFAGQALTKAQDLQGLPGFAIQVCFVREESIFLLVVTKC
jgi:hypothetical protein